MNHILFRTPNPEIQMATARWYLSPQSYTALEDVWVACFEERGKKAQGMNLTRETTWQKTLVSKTISEHQGGLHSSDKHTLLYCFNDYHHSLTLKQQRPQLGSRPTAASQVWLEEDCFQIVTLICKKARPRFSGTHKQGCPHYFRSTEATLL